ncbi:MAG: hypothetical protein ABI861_05540, partial [Panacibacter sp.]
MKGTEDLVNECLLSLFYISHYSIVRILYNYKRIDFHAFKFNIPSLPSKRRTVSEVYFITFESMRARNIFFLLITAVCSLVISCKKTSFTNSPNASLFTSEDTLHFDTVFTALGSITQSFKMFNANDQKLRINNIELAGGNGSVFKMNVDGTTGTSFNNIEIAPNDSIYIFVAVTIDPTNSNNPFLIRDSIRINYNSKETFVQLDAYGQNASFLNNATVTKDTTWSNKLPLVISGSLTVAQGNTLTIQKGAKVYCHAGTAITVNGTLKAIGEKYDSTKILFRNDRLDDYYKDLPASWQGIVFTETSTNNELIFASVLNATNAIVVRNPSTNSNPKLSMQQCIVDNASNAGVYGIYSSIEAVNCLITNCSQNIKIVAGGDYNFTHCTVAAYSNLFLTHNNPVLSITDIDDNNQSFTLTANFANSIFYGDNGIIADEIYLLQADSNIFDVNFENVLYKGNSVNANFTNPLQNQDPNFVSIEAYDNIYNFHLQEISPCIGAAKNTAVNIDIDGNERDA